MTDTYEIYVTLYDGEHANMIQYVMDDDGDIYKINHNQHSFDYVWEHEFVLDLEDEMRKATGIRLRSDADKTALLDMLDYSAAERLEYLLERI